MGDVGVGSIIHMLEWMRHHVPEVLQGDNIHTFSDLVVRYILTESNFMKCLNKISKS